MDRNLFEAVVLGRTLIDDEDYQRVYEHYDLAITALLKKPHPGLCGNVRLGISVGLGWIPLIDELCSKIEALEAANPGFTVTFVQVKEKFGGLRVYPHYDNKGDSLKDAGALSGAVNRLIAEAEREAWVTCATCGAPGTLQHANWLYVACPEHVRKEVDDEL